MRTLVRLSPEQVDALTAWKEKKGRSWKRLLRQAWETGRYNWRDSRISYLQEIRNLHGSQVLN